MPSPTQRARLYLGQLCYQNATNLSRQLKGGGIKPDIIQQHHTSHSGCLQWTWDFPRPLSDRQKKITLSVLQIINVLGFSSKQNPQDTPIYTNIDRWDWDRQKEGGRREREWENEWVRRSRIADGLVLVQAWRPENQENKWCGSKPKPDVLETQEEWIQFGPKGGKRWYPS